MSTPLEYLDAVTDTNLNFRGLTPTDAMGGAGHPAPPD